MVENKKMEGFMKKSWQQPTIIIVELEGSADVLTVSLSETGIDTSDWWGGDL